MFFLILYICEHKIKTMIKITLPDGSIRKFEKGATPMEVAKNISEGFARNVISASFNSTTIETTTPLETDGSLTLYTWNDTEGKKAFASFVSANQMYISVLISSASVCCLCVFNL